MTMFFTLGGKIQRTVLELKTEKNLFWGTFSPLPSLLHLPDVPHCGLQPEPHGGLSVRSFQHPAPHGHILEASKASFISSWQSSSRESPASQSLYQRETNGPTKRNLLCTLPKRETITESQRGNEQRTQNRISALVQFSDHTVCHSLFVGVFSLLKAVSELYKIVPLGLC